MIQHSCGEINVCYNGEGKLLADKDIPEGAELTQSAFDNNWKVLLDAGTRWQMLKRRCYCPTCLSDQRRTVVACTTCEKPMSLEGDWICPDGHKSPELTDQHISFGSMLLNELASPKPSFRRLLLEVDGCTLGYRHWCTAVIVYQLAVTKLGGLPKIVSRRLSFPMFCYLWCWINDYAPTLKASGRIIRDLLGVMDHLLNHLDDVRKAQVVALQLKDYLPEPNDHVRGLCELDQVMLPSTSFSYDSFEDELLVPLQAMFGVEM
eukprot:TRINITY_DN52850_c0_g1_i2.p1 TRINITY_DN52850_c0_g1~~TRINITY_DN52850_c0_g1_i2.p1  ORF type:complete len:263 (-),score=8.09 TRINITY_DN52850_c0_g1_i2:70-858(-)